jgi:uncharacterized protein YvpB
MYISLFIASTIMFALLLFYYHKATKKILQYMSIIYLFLFGMTSVGLGSYFIYSIDFTWIYAADTHSYTSTRQSTTSRIVTTKVPRAMQLTAPIVRQFPELPRGCEVTSLSMLLQYHGVDTNKMTLANEIKKNSTPYELIDGKVHFGDPNKGFVGNMYTFDEPGLGVYHKPIFELASDYVGDAAKDLTGESFDTIIHYVANKQPVLLITNITYEPLKESQFRTWYTESGPMNITMKLHAVLVTGYDQASIYFNDPYDGKQKKAPKDAFIKAWEQMGKQAVSIQL